MTSSLLHKKQGFSIVEILTVISILGIFIGTFYSVFILNWEAINENIAKADMAQEINQIIEPLSRDVHSAEAASNGIVYTMTINSQQVSFNDINGNPIPSAGTYLMKSNGEFHIIYGGTDTLVTTNLDYPNCSFTPQGNALSLKLSLKQIIFDLPVTLSTNTEIYPRNAPTN